VRPAEGIEAFWAAPAGRFVSGESWAYYCADTRFFGQIYWGVPSVGDVERLAQAWVAERRFQHVSLVDARQLEAVGHDAFAAQARAVAENLKVMRGKLERQAIVRPSGVTGATVSGFYSLLRPDYPVEVFEDLEGALAWLERPELLPAIVALGEQLRGEDAMVRLLQQHLRGTLQSATLPAAAQSLGVSERTLQRRLRDAGTTFQDELQAARVREAERLLADPERKLTAIAAEVGCASLQHFSGLFRRLKGMSPTEWRSRRR
jgi:AraC-like DNA-binding protein